MRPHVPELAMPEGHDRARLTALRALRNCGVIRVTIGKVPLGYRLLQTAGYVRASPVPDNPDQADCRLTGSGVDFALTGLKPPYRRDL